jgi:hypothetical protein
MARMNATPCVERVSDPTEVRFGERVALRLPVTLAGNGLAGGGILRDISISGALIETGLELPVFTNLVVSLPAQGESAPPRNLAACVVRRSVAGIGIEWRDMACPTLMALLHEAGSDATNVAPCDSAA